MATVCMMAERMAPLRPAGLPPAQLRTAQPRDVPAVAAIEASCFSDAWSEAAFHSLLRTPAARFTVAEQAERVCGYTLVMIAADEADLANIAVAPAVRRRGIGQLLLGAALRAAEQEGVASMYLEVRESNVGARQLYTSHGFAMRGRRKAYYRDPVEDALVLVWRPAETRAPAPASAAAPAPTR